MVFTHDELSNMSHEKFAELLQQNDTIVVWSKEEDREQKRFGAGECVVSAEHKYYKAYSEAQWRSIQGYDVIIAEEFQRIGLFSRKLVITLSCLSASTQS
jgi:hypothetical protein